MDNNKEQIETYKIVLIGDASVGKTHILKRYSKDELPKNPAPTIGVEFGTKVVQLKDGTKVKAQIWDTAGQERYRSILSLHFRRAIGALLVYDITKESTFNSIGKWMEELKGLADANIVIMLVGNKQDIVQQDPQKRRVTTKQAEEFATQNNLIFMETSAVLGTKIKDVFEALLQEIYQKRQTNPEEKVTTNPPLDIQKQNPNPAENNCQC